MEYLGDLPADDPLHPFLEAEVLPQLGYENGPPAFRVFRLGTARGVYLYEEHHVGLRMVGKFFGPPEAPGTPDTCARMEREFQNLHLLRGYGLVGYPHHVVRPLACNAWLSSLLVVEYALGAPLGAFLDAAIYREGGPALLEKLTALAYFLATVHNRTANGQGVDFHADCAYLDRQIGRLAALGLLDGDTIAELTWLRDRWRAQPRMWEDQQVLVHGDATPANFVFGDGRQVIAIDLERMRRADRVFDLGRLAGEIQHAFIEATGDKYAAEMYIGHFLWEYACHFPDRDRAFASITGRVPFQMALTLLRIARNPWVGPDQQRRLVAEAFTTLRLF